MPDEFSLSDVEDLLELHKEGFVTMWPKGLPPHLAECLLNKARSADVKDVHNGEDQCVVDSIRKALSCPITGKVPGDAVYCKVDGMTYDRFAITSRIALGMDCQGYQSPFVKGPVTKADLMPNYIVHHILTLLKSIETRRTSEAPSTPESRPSSESRLSAFTCPITLCTMSRPCTTPSGHSYEEDALHKHIDKCGTSPQTRRPLTRSDARRNLSLEHAIDESQGILKDAENEKKKLVDNIISFESHCRGEEVVPNKRRRLTMANSF